MDILLGIVKWLLIILSVWGIVRAVIWCFWDDDWHFGDFLKDWAFGEFIPFYYTQGEALVKILPLLILILLVAVFTELPAGMQDRLMDWVDAIGAWIDGGKN